MPRSRGASRSSKVSVAAPRRAARPTTPSALVDHFDNDGKHFLIAVENAPTVDRRGELTASERQTGALAAAGHLDKEIAYILGVSVSTVAATLRRVREKLGIRKRAELAMLWRR